MINHINQNQDLHIVTLEDPVSTCTKDIKSPINQREVGIDMPADHSQWGSRRCCGRSRMSFLVGEMRDAHTFETAIHAAETGHLVLAPSMPPTRNKRCSGCHDFSRRSKA